MYRNVYLWKYRYIEVYIYKYFYIFLYIYFDIYIRMEGFLPRQLFCVVYEEILKDIVSKQ